MTSYYFSKKACQMKSYPHIHKTIKKKKEQPKSKGKTYVHRFLSFFSNPQRTVNYF